MKKIILALVIVGLVSGVSFAATSAERIITNSVSMLDEITDQSDVSGMADTVRGAHAVAIIPSMVKAGFILGGQYGEGLILVRDKGKWYGPSFYNIGGASFGFQIGAQSIALLLAVINERGVEAFFLPTYSLTALAFGAMNELNLSTPRDIGIVAFDESDLYRLGASTIAHIVQPLRELGEKSFEVLHAMIENEPCERNIILKPELVPGGSVIKKA